MSENLYDEKLDWFKENEAPEVVLLVANDKVRIKLIIAWTNTEVIRPKKLTSLRRKTENGIWEWLWENCEFSPEELCEKAGLDRDFLYERMEPLIGNRIVYPDGTINSYVQRYLREEVLKHFEGKKQRGTKKKKAV